MNQGKFTFITEWSLRIEINYKWRINDKFNCNNKKCTNLRLIKMLICKANNSNTRKLLVTLICYQISIFVHASNKHPTCHHHIFT